MRRTHSADREGIYRYDEAPDVRIKRILNYEAPYPVADRVLSALFTRHLGDSVAFARGLYLSAAQIREMAHGGMTFGFHTETPSGAVAARRRERSGPSCATGRVSSLTLTGQRSVSFCYPYGFSHTYNADTLSVLDGVRLFDGVQHGPPRSDDSARISVTSCRGSTRAMWRVPYEVPAGA